MTCILCVDFTMAMHVLLFEEYRRRFPDRTIPSSGVFSRIHHTMRETGCLPSVAAQSEREVVPMINTREHSEDDSENFTTVHL